MTRPLDRRQFVQGIGTRGMLLAVGEVAPADVGATAVRWPKLTGSPVLDSLHPVIRALSRRADAFPQT